MLQIRDVELPLLVHGRDELVAGLEVDALAQAEDSGSRQAALVHSSSESVDGGCATTCARRIEAGHGTGLPAGAARETLRETNGVRAGLHHPRGAAGPTSAPLARAHRA